MSKGDTLRSHSLKCVTISNGKSIWDKTRSARSVAISAVNGAPIKAISMCLHYRKWINI